MQVEPKNTFPVHGFVLAGGKSSRMGCDKATLPFCGLPLVEIALRKLQEVCAEISIAGNRDDLRAFSPVVHETRLEVGPAAGIEAGLAACRRPWALFIPLDVPLLPAWLLRAWVEDLIKDEGMKVSGSYLVVAGHSEPVFCMLRREILPSWIELLDQGERKLKNLLTFARVSGWGSVREMMAAKYAPNITALELRSWSSNVNTPHELVEASRRAKR